MFFKLVSRNSRRSRKENGLFFASLIVSIVAFYIIMSLSNQDVIIFLRKMESDAVNKLMLLIPAFYVLTLVILFFLIYFAGKYQLERRCHEFGIYLMMGMQRTKLFLMLLAEDIKNSVLSLLIGIPVAVAISELISLMTARAVGLGIIGHRFSFSLSACAFTIVGFLVIKFAAFLILSGKISRKEIGSLLTAAPEGAKRQLPAVIYIMALIIGLACLFMAYGLGFNGVSWRNVRQMLLTLALGFIGTLLFFFGLRMIMALILKIGRKDKSLATFNFRQLQESVMSQSKSIAVSCILIIAGLCCFGSGVAYTSLYGQADHILDYTFVDDTYEEATFAAKVNDALDAYGLADQFSSVFEMKTGHVKTESHKGVFDCSVLLDALEQLPDSEDRAVLLNNMSYVDDPHLICLSSYNNILEAAGKPKLTLSAGEAAVYIGKDFTTETRTKMMNSILENGLKSTFLGEDIVLKGEINTDNFVTDRSITYMFALILPDEEFDRYTQNEYNLYINAILKEEIVREHGLMGAISGMNEKLNQTGLIYESFLQNMGRQLFYIVAASYITIYMALIFLIVSNTILGVQFLMNQQKTSQRYMTLVRLGADYDMLYTSLKKQVNWYFGIPIFVAALNSVAASRVLIPVLLSSGMEGNIYFLMGISCAMILLLCVVEWIYMWAVKRAAGKYLLTMMAPRREE